jgi:hypothetical protein
MCNAMLLLLMIIDALPSEVVGANNALVYAGRATPKPFTPMGHTAVRDSLLLFHSPWAALTRTGFN